jgi:hypothetical protein
VAAVLVLATLLWTVASFSVWVKRQAVDTDNWVDTSTELLENEPVRTAPGLYIVDKLYANAEVEQRLREALPPNLDRLAGPAAAGLKEIARRNAPRLLGNAVALDAWREANRVAHHNRGVRLARVDQVTRPERVPERAAATAPGGAARGAPGCLSQAHSARPARSWCG